MRENLLRGIAIAAGLASVAALVVVATLQGTYALFPLAVIVPAWAGPLAVVWYRGNKATLAFLQYGLSLALVAAYPFMKRITGWPQIWLGLVFSWAALVGWSEPTGALTPAGISLYVGTIFWVVGYDTIYALQDREDDALIGIGSSALSMGRHVRAGVALCYLCALGLWAGAIWQVRPQALALAALLPVAVHLLWQIATLREDGVDPLAKFRSNRFAGLLMFLGCLVVGSA